MSKIDAINHAHGSTTFFLQLKVLKNQLSVYFCKITLE